MKTRLLIAGAVAIGSLGLVACGDDDDDGGKADDGGGGAPSGDSVDYEITGLSYTDLTAPAGGTIKITNDSGVAHTFDSDEEGVIESDVAADGETDVQAPDEAGTYPFHCDIHPSMKATLTVEG